MKQRFNHFNKASSFFKSVIAIEQPTVIERIGFMQFFKWLNLRLRTRVTNDTVLNLTNLKNKLKPLPYFFDVINYQSIQEPEFISYINRMGIAIINRSDK